MHFDWTVNFPTIFTIVGVIWALIATYYSNKQTIAALKESITDLRELIAKHERCIDILERDNHWMRNFITKMAQKLMSDEDYFSIIKDVDNYIDRFHTRGMK